MERKEGTTKRRKKPSSRKSSFQPLVKRPNLTEGDLVCNICLSTLFEPVTAPCYHSFCHDCLRRHLDETSNKCPVCEKRLSLWCRQNMKGNARFLDTKLWERIETEHPALVERMIAERNEHQ